MTPEEKSDFGKVLYILESDPSTGHIGIAETLQIHTKEIREIREEQKKIQERNKVIHRFAVGVAGVFTFVVGKSWSHIVILVKGAF